jgi:enoyl-CoA hydratase/carnithine racemase
VNRAIPPEALLEETMAYARDIAVNCSPASMATMKRQVYGDLERALPDALARADQAMIDSFMAPDFAEGVASFVERREPSFAPVSGQLV